MIPRLEDSLINNQVPSSIGKPSKFIQSDLELSKLKEINNLKDLTNLSNLKENNYTTTHSNMKMDLVIYDPIPSLGFKIQSNSLSSKLTNDTTSTTNTTVQSSDKFQTNDNLKENHVINQQQQKENQLGLIGLTNLGNTCYMNSGLQCLFNNRKLILFFLNEYLKNSSKINLANNSLTSCFISLMKKVWNRTRDYNVIKPYEFKEIMSQNYSQFQGFRQHDCQEFLTLLLGTLHDQINQGLKLDNNQIKTINELVANNNSSSSKEEESPQSNCSNDLMDLSSRTTSPKSSLSVSTSSTYCDQLSEEEAENNQNVKKEEILNHLNETTPAISQTVINPIRLINNINNNINKSSIKTISKDDFKNSLQLSVKELTSKDTKLNNTNLHTDLSEELAYDSKKFNKTSTDNELNIICSTAKQLTNRIEINHHHHHHNNNNEDYHSDRYSDSTSTNSSTTSILKRNKKRNNPSSTITKDHHRQHLKNLNECESIQKLNKNLEEEEDLEEKYNSPKRMKTEEHDLAAIVIEQQQQFDNLKNEKFSSELEWTKYLNKNKSIIVDTFQGQFKSTVLCSNCYNVSITYEPFMYLPVTLPNALERQLFVTYIPSSSDILYTNNEIRPARRYLITLNKHDKLEKLANQLKELLIKDQMANEATQFCFAEVEDKFINKILDNNTFLKYVDDKFRDLYAFEMIELTFTTTYPTIAMPKLLWDQPTTVDLISPQLPNNQSLLTPNSDYDFNGQTSSFINNTTFMNDATTFHHQAKPNFTTTTATTSLNNEIDLTTQTASATTIHNSINQLNQINDTKLNLNNFNDGGYFAPLNDNFSNKKFIDFLGTGDKLTTEDNYLKDVNSVIGASVNSETTNDLKIDLNPSNQFSLVNSKSDDLQIVDDNFDNLLPIQLSCAICLEEKDTSQLLIHPACSCQLCATCLDMTVKHCSEDEMNFLCPTCSLYINKTHFLPFGTKKPQPGFLTTR